MSIFTTHLTVCVAEDEAHSGEEIALAGAISTDDDIVLGRKGVYNRLGLVASDYVSDSTTIATDKSSEPFEALYRDLFDVHLEGCGALVGKGDRVHTGSMKTKVNVHHLRPQVRRLDAQVSGGERRQGGIAGQWNRENAWGK